MYDAGEKKKTQGIWESVGWVQTNPSQVLLGAG
jgi:hypothetical protein